MQWWRWHFKVLSVGIGYLIYSFKYLKAFLLKPFKAISQEMSSLFQLLHLPFKIASCSEVGKYNSYFFKIFFKQVFSVVVVNLLEISLSKFF